MTATLQEIHWNPEILDLAIAARENLEVLSHGEPAATLVPIVRFSQDEARSARAPMFPSQDSFDSLLGLRCELS